MVHRAGARRDAGLFDGDENISSINTATRRSLPVGSIITKTAFLSPEDEAHFIADTSGKKFLDAGLQILRQIHRRDGPA